MSRNYYRKNKGDNQDNVFSIIVSFTTLFIGYLAFVYYTNRGQFWYEMNHYILPAGGVVVAALFTYFFFIFYSKKRRENHFSNLIQKINESGFDSNIKNFINSFGKEGKVEPWTYREYSFDWKRLDDFRENAINHKIDISIKDYDDLIDVLKYFIDKMDKSYLDERIETKKQNSLDELSKNGEDFENLIVRLYDSMGYVSKRTGGHGDQGGDVIASKNGENIIIQAKYYHGAVGNTAVQQVVGALKFYNCSKAVVVTTAYFTPEATALAKSNLVELVDGNLLKKRLQEHLHEVWQ